MTDFGRLFVVGRDYTRQEIYELLDVPKPEQRGNWETGYHQFQDTFFIFCNIGSAGRSGRNYGNEFDGDELVWLSKTGTRLGQPQIARLLEPGREVLIFFRRDNRQAFTFQGRGTASAIQQRDDAVQVRWLFNSIDESHPERSAEEIPQGQTYPEGAVQQVLVNRYERNPAARAACIAQQGALCSVCGFDFAKVYGSMGSGFIHVHHLRSIASLPADYQIDSAVDLIPVCPNCHAMLHRAPWPSPAELRALIVPWPLTSCAPDATSGDGS